MNRLGLLKKEDIYFLISKICIGMTSEGGGAVAFPVMTLALNISPGVARDFSLMIQSCGKFLKIMAN